jgi:hypothetical protein
VGGSAATPSIRGASLVVAPLGLAGYCSTVLQTPHTHLSSLPRGAILTIDGGISLVERPARIHMGSGGEKTLIGP